VPLDHGRRKSQPAGWLCEKEALNVGRIELRTCNCAQLMEPEDDVIFVDVADGRNGST